MAAHDHGELALAFIGHWTNRVVSVGRRLLLWPVAALRRRLRRGRLFDDRGRQLVVEKVSVVRWGSRGLGFVV